MKSDLETPVVIFGGGPVGLLLALDLASRNIASTVVEKRHEHQPPSVKCNHISSRTMEILRRLGFVKEVRQAGMPDDYPNDVVVRTRATGWELMRIPIPNRLERYSSTQGPDTHWATPEPPHRANQIYFDPVLYQQAKLNSLITILFEHEGLDFEQDSDGVTSRIRNLKSGELVNLRSQFLVGCEGGRSLVRKQIGAEFQGDAVIQRVQSTYIRAPKLLSMMSGKPAWMSYLYTPERAGNLVAIDGKETWLVHNYLLEHEKDFDSVNRDYCIRVLLGVDENFAYEVLGNEDWFGRRLVADKFRDRRVFICGDASHLWVPYAGYGMNAGIADAMNLSWTLSAFLNGWAPESFLDNYENERHPITEQVSRFAMQHAEQAIRERTSITPLIEENSAAGADLRKKVGEEAYRLHVQQFACAGLNYGYYYDKSNIIVYDTEPHPAYTMHDYTPSTVPGCRLPHVWLADGASIYDRLGSDYTLLSFTKNVDTSHLMQCMALYRIPIDVVQIPADEKPAHYLYDLFVVRSDQHIAWRGNALPEDMNFLARKLSARA